MSAQHQGLRLRTSVGRRDIEGVVHRARRMIRRHVERREVVEILFDLRAVGDIEADRAKDCFDALDRQGDRMQPAGAHTAPGQRDIDPLGGEPLLQQRLAQLRVAQAEQRFHLLLGLVQRLATARLGFAAQRRQRFHQPGERAGLAHERRLDVGQLRLLGHGGDPLAGLSDDRLKIGIHCVHPSYLFLVSRRRAAAGGSCCVGAPTKKGLADP
jgi:hypothetical protein